jgi:hypothetical protein
MLNSKVIPSTLAQFEECGIGMAVVQDRKE